MSKPKREISIWQVIFSSSVLCAVAYLLLGIILVASPDISYTNLCYIAAAAVMLIGLIDVIRYILKGVTEGKLNNYLARGLVLVIISVFMFVREDYVVIVLPILLGLAIVIDGIVKLQRSVDLMRLHFEGWILVLVLAAMSLVIGGILVFQKIEGSSTLTMLTGIALIYCGVTSIVVSIFVHLKLRKYREQLLAEEEPEPGNEPEEPAAIPVSTAPALAPVSAPAYVQIPQEEEYPVPIQAAGEPVQAAAEMMGFSAEEPQPAFDPMAGINFGDEPEVLPEEEPEEEEPKRQAVTPMEASEGDIPFENIEI